MDAERIKELEAKGFVVSDDPDEFLDDLMDWELCHTPGFITAMTYLIEGIDSGEISLDQWRKV